MLFGSETFEIGILQGIQAVFSCGVMDFLMTFFSRLGDGGVIWILWALVLTGTKKYRRLGLATLAGLALGFLIGNVVLKNWVMRPRPCWIMPDIPLLIAVPQDYSFPSGHTVSSFAAAFTLFHGNRKMGIAALVLAGLIAFSRMYLFVHFPTDILGGLAVALCAHLIVKGIDDKWMTRFC